MGTNWLRRGFGIRGSKPLMSQATLKWLKKLNANENNVALAA